MRTSVRRQNAFTPIISANQPQDAAVYPKQQDGARYRYFNLSWYRQWPWLHWSSDLKAVICFTCHNASGLKMLTFTSKENVAFITQGFCKWKNACEAFAKHDSSASHSESKAKWMHYTRGTSVSVQLDSQHSKEQEIARACLMKQLTSLRYLLRQGLAMRGHDEMNGNYLQLLKMRCSDTDGQNLQSWMNRCQSWLSPEVQNEQMELIAHAVLREVAKQIQQRKFFAIIVDETTDISTQEQVSLCFRTIDDQFQIYEDFLGLYKTCATNASTLTEIIKDALLRFDLPISLCRGQCYDGASSMSGVTTGVAARIRELEPRALNIKCLAHSLNLAVQTCTTDNRIMMDAMSSIQEVSKLIGASAKRLGQFELYQIELAPDAPTVRPMCPTRWTVRLRTLQSFVANFKPILLTLGELADERAGKESSIKASGLLTHIECFEFVFGMNVCLTVFQQTDMLSNALQTASLDIGEALVAAKLAVNDLRRARTNEFFESLYSKAENVCAENKFPPPSLPRKRFLPRRIDEGSEPHSFKCPREYYRIAYYSCLDTIIAAANDRFEQPALKLYQTIEETLMNAVHGREFAEGLNLFGNHFGSDLDLGALTRQLHSLQDLFSEQQRLSCRSVSAVLSRILDLGSSLANACFQQVLIVIKLYQLLPVTSASAERSFSALRRLKTYLRNSMRQGRLNHCAVVHTHQDIADDLDLRRVAEDFIAARDRRRIVFGHF